jgi:UDP-N-acetylglucosamine 2-epimerase (non-hydrolysing)
MKIAPILSAMGSRDEVETLLVHTGQHYDEQMSQQFFGELGIPAPDVNLGVGSGSHANQTASVMTAFEPVCVQHRPDWVVVVGDVNSTVACALVAVKLGIRVAHVESGLRSGDRTMPEEINRILTDAISDLLFVTEPSGIENLLREGISASRVHHVGNVMIDTLLKARAAADQSEIMTQLGLSPRCYAALTLHRPSNVDNAAVLSGILDAIESIAREMPVVFPLHPRTRNSLEALGLHDRVEQVTNLHLVHPLGYLDFLNLIAHAGFVLSDSGGIQEETTILGVPCLTLRNNTERPITLTEGTNRLVGVNPVAILDAFADVRLERDFAARTPALWDGHAAERIVDTIVAEQSATDTASLELATA